MRNPRWRCRGPRDRGFNRCGEVEFHLDLDLRRLPTTLARVRIPPPTSWCVHTHEARGSVTHTVIPDAVQMYQCADSNRIIRHALRCESLVWCGR